MTSRAMRFEISYGSGTTHEVQLAGTVVTLGRDPDCDIVLNDVKCSRRHAVIEEGPRGLTVRDAGSANGVYVNGRHVDQSPIAPGDALRLGDVIVKVLAEIGETVVVALEDVEPRVLDREPRVPERAEGAPRLRPTVQRRPAAPAAFELPLNQPRPSPHRSAGPPPPSRAGSAATRPLTVSVLSGLWALLVPLAIGLVALAAWRFEIGVGGWLAAILLGGLLATLGIAMSVGLRALAPWARHLQVVAASFGLAICPLSLAAATVLLYMARADVKRTFDPLQPRARGEGAGSAETTFALSLVAMVVVGIALSALALLLFAPRRAA